MTQVYMLVDSNNYAFRKNGREVTYNDETTAKRMRTRMIRSGTMRPEFQVKTAEQWRNDDVMVEKTNLMSGKKFMISRNTPLCCDPSSETYWSM